DSCGTAAMPELANNGDPSCKPAMVAAWGANSGPVALDRDGNAFVVMSSTDASMKPINDARAFAAAQVATGAAPAAATPFFTLPHARAAGAPARRAPPRRGHRALPGVELPELRGRGRAALRRPGLDRPAERHPPPLPQGRVAEPRGPPPRRRPGPPLGRRPRR